MFQSGDDGRGRWWWWWRKGSLGVLGGGDGGGGRICLLYICFKFEAEVKKDEE